MSAKVFARSRWQLLKIGLVANVLEWYEFSVYGYLAGTMGQLFLQSAQPITALIQAYSLFTISYLARPLGSFVWGYIGDKIGRSPSLKASLLLMSVSTAAIGFLPTYEQVGFLATGSLLILRLISGFAASGELPTSGCYVFEAAEPKQRSLLCSTVAIGTIIGLLSGSLVATLLFWYFDQKTILAWAWRIPYLLSIPITLWIAYLRRAIHEPDRNTPSRSAISKTAAPFSSLFKASKSKLLQMGLLIAFEEVCPYVLLLWLPAYLVHFLNVPSSIAQFYNTVMLIALAAFCLFAGYLSGRVGYKRLLITHMLALTFLSYPLFQALQQASYGVLFGIHLVFAYLLSGVSGVSWEMLGDAFPKAVRCSGMSLAFTLPAAIFGGTAPLICTWLTDKTGLLLFPAFYMIAFGLLALPAALRLKSEPPSQSTPPLMAA